MNGKIKKQGLYIEIIITVLALLCNFSLLAKDVKITSPNGNYQMRIFERDGSIYYSVDYKNKPVILESLLGINSSQSGKAIESDATLDNKAVADWVNDLKIDSTAERYVDAAWFPVYGERSLYADLHNSCIINILKNTSNRRIQIVVRAYNEGVAFHYRFTGSEYLLYWYDKPSESQDEPELEFFDRVPTVWDDTKVIHGEVGQYITIARRSGNEWFVGTMTNNDARKLKIPLDFLQEGKKYTAKVFFDNGNKKRVHRLV